MRGVLGVVAVLVVVVVGVAGRMYLAVRGKPRVAVIDAVSGRALRDLLLPGIPVLIAGSP